MGATAALFSRATDGRQGTPEAGTQGDAERHLLDRPKRSGLAQPAGAVRPMADGVQAVQGMVGSGLIEKIIHELGEDADLQDISIDSTYIKVHKASAGAERGGFQTPQTP